MKTKEEKIVKITPDVVITNKDYDVMIEFKDGYVMVKSDTKKALTNSEILYYLERASFKIKLQLEGY